MLDAKVTAKYRLLSEDEVKTLVIDDKWLATIANDVQSELNRISQALTGRVKELAESYVTPLPKLTEDIEVLSSKVDKQFAQNLEIARQNYSESEQQMVHALQSTQSDIAPS